MPSIKLTKTFISSLEIPNKTTDYFDSEVKGLILRISKTGIISYRIKYYINRQQRIYTIAKHGAITLMQAKKEAQRLLGLVSQGIDIQQEKKQSKIETKELITFSDFFENFASDWYKKNNRAWERDVQSIKTTFSSIFSKSMNNVNNKRFMEKFLANKREQQNWTNETYNRHLARIKGLFSRAVEHELLKSNNLSQIKKLKIISKKVRYLSERETKNFFEALPKQSVLVQNIILIAYYTGMRKNEILTLSWDDIDIDTNQIVLQAHNTKANKTRYIPINPKIKTILTNSKNEKGLIFKNNKGTQVTQIEKQWRKFKKEAEIENFRFHDLRHNFCSMLVMKGVPIYTVAQLAGHADVKTTQIYAHLSPDVKKSAIDLL